MTGNLRDVAPHRDRSGRDPAGKRALFSTPTDSPTVPPAHAPVEPAAPPAEPAAPGVQGDPEPRTVVVECGECGETTRLSYFDFALLNLPISFFLPIPGRRFKHRMTCPACSRWTWLEARWRE